MQVRVSRVPGRLQRNPGARGGVLGELGYAYRAGGAGAWRGGTASPQRIIMRTAQRGKAIDILSVWCPHNFCGGSAVGKLKNYLGRALKPVPWTRQL